MSQALSAIVLAGGASRRMGLDKRSIVAGGRPMLTAATRLAAQLADEVIVSCRREAPPEAGLDEGLPVRVVFDGREGGPLAGLESSLAVATCDLVLVLAVDMPRLTLPMLRALVGAAVDHPLANGAVFAGGPVQTPFPAVLRRSVLPLVSEQLDRGSLRIGELLRRLDLATLPVAYATRLAGPNAFLNVNVPGDLASVEQASAAGDPDRAHAIQEEKRMDLERCLATVRELSGASRAEPLAPSEQEITALLDFTRAVAHASERKDAPLAAYAIGIAMSGLKPAERAGVLSRAAEAIDRAAATEAQ